MADYHKPTISMRTVDGNRYWVLDYTLRGQRPFQPSYELRVRFNGIEHTQRFFVWEDGDSRELLTREERQQQVDDIMANESVNCPAHASCPMGEEGCDDCGEATSKMAWETLDGRSRQIEGFEVKMREHLERTWAAFETLFDPAYTV